jgi:hydrogenase/urease accessory protein HupE
VTRLFRQPLFQFVFLSAAIVAAYAWMTRLPPAATPALADTAPPAASYLVLGIGHILFGIDHLLFVFGLTMIVKEPRRLLVTVTAFTITHSLTLALATLGFVRLPGPPVEAVIALSILFVASEVLRFQRGEAPLLARAPWMVAAVFGLLHGFGFAGALSEVGLPHGEVGPALFSFNAGVEIGQVAFLGAVLGIGAALRRTRTPLPRWTGPAASWALGSVAAVWVVQRCAAF